MRHMVELLQAHLTASLNEQACLRDKMELMEDKLDGDWDNSSSESEKSKKKAMVSNIPANADNDAKTHSAQARLAKDLIKLANTYKVLELSFSDKASKR